MLSGEQIIRAIDERRDLYLDVLFRLLRQPSISTQNVGVEDCAELVRQVLEEAGVPARVMPTDGLPVVFGESHQSDRANTLLLYGHYDVQPPEPYDEWISPPFEPQIRDGRIYARGSGDNKGQFLAHILAVRLLSELGQLPELNLKFLLEGEEESGSPNLPAFVAQNEDLLRADLFYAADGPRHISNRPVVFFGLRGTLHVEFEVRGTNRDLHSGNFGGPAPNAVWKLINLLATMRSPDGRASIGGFYDQVLQPSQFERQLLEQIPFDDQAVKSYLGIDAFDGPPELSYYEKIMFQPTLNITGIAGGYTEPGVKSVIPSKATVKLETRLVPNQSPDEIYEKIAQHVRKHAPDVVVQRKSSILPSKTSPDLPVSRVVISAIADAFGVDPVVMPLLGASAGPNFLFTDLLKIPAIWVTYGPYDENNHAPNENMTVDSFFEGVRASVEVIQRFAAIPSEQLEISPQGRSLSIGGLDGAGSN